MRLLAAARSGFSLIEVLVVLAIVSILFAMGFSTLGQERRSSEVQAEAERLAAVLRLTRNRAVNEQRSFGVAFNIRNAIGTSGAVLNNWDGGHFYRVFGPEPSSRNPPIARSQRDLNNLPVYLDTLKQCWASAPYRLPARSVRFLALSDLDRGPRRHKRSGGGGWAAVYYDGDASYPRPWFGCYETATGTLHAWGGYDKSKDYSGFYFEGKDGDIEGCTHPSDRSYNNDFDGKNGFTNVDTNNDGDFDDPYEREVGYVIWRKGEGRELVNANWLDAAIVFLPTGEARFLEWNRQRRVYIAEQTTDSKNYYRNGVADRCLEKRPGAWIHFDRIFESSALSTARTAEQPESTHFVVHTGGWNITLAADADRDDNHFDSVDEALRSITPAMRVHVSQTGVVRVLRVQHPRSDSFLKERPTWPDSPTDWQNVSLIKEFHRDGWLHESYTSGVPEPMGEPIIDKVSPRMLTDRIWWFKE